MLGKFISPTFAHSKQCSKTLYTHTHKRTPENLFYSLLNERRLPYVSGTFTVFPDFSLDTALNKGSVMNKFPRVLLKYLSLEMKLLIFFKCLENKKTSYVYHIYLSFFKGKDKGNALITGRL